MTATPNEIERHYTQPPDDDDVVCTECDGVGAFVAYGVPGAWIRERVCPRCDGTGYISAERAAEDAAEAHGDQQMEMARDAAIEHATGFEE